MWHQGGLTLIPGQPAVFSDWGGRFKETSHGTGGIIGGMEFVSGLLMNLKCLFIAGDNGKGLACLN